MLTTGKIGVRKEFAVWLGAVQFMGIQGPSIARARNHQQQHKRRIKSIGSLRVRFGIWAENPWGLSLMERRLNEQWSLRKCLDKRTTRPQHKVGAEILKPWKALSRFLGLQKEAFDATFEQPGRVSSVPAMIALTPGSSLLFFGSAR